MNGDAGAGGRRGAGRGSGGRGDSGRGDDGYGAPGYGDDGYGGPDGYGQPGGYSGPESGDAGYGQEGYGDRAGEAPGGYGRSGGYPVPGSGQGYGDYGQGSGQARGRGQGYDQAGEWPDPRSQGQRGGQGSPQYNPRTGPQPTQRGGGWPQADRGSDWPQGQPGAGGQPTWQGSGSQQVPDPGTGPRQAQRGTGQARQTRGGRDPRGSGRRRAADGYPGEGYQGGGYPARGDARFSQGGYEGRDSEGGDDSFVPGFGRRDEFDGGRDPGRGRGAGYAGGAARQAGNYGGYDGGRGRRDTRGRGDQHGEDGWDQPPRRRGPVRRLAPWIALLVILTPIAIGAYYVYHLYETKYHPADYSGPGIAPTVTVQVKSGDNAFILGPELQALGVVASARAFERAAEATSSTTVLEVGFYKLNHHMQASLAYAALLNPKDRVVLTVTIPEGKRVSQVILLLAKATNIPAADFQKVVNNPAGLGLPSYAMGKVEGYLFPATYPIQPNETALQVLQAMVARYNVEAQQVNLAKAAANVGLTSQQVIIEASMAQAEGGSVKDYARIARVIINRLHDGMKLQFDSILLYGLKAYGINVTNAQIATPGPYNDFQHAGLPPTPINNPGDAAIQGILHPASGPWLYFLTNSHGTSMFSATPLNGQ